MRYDPPFTPANKKDARELLMNAMKGKTFATVLPYEDGVDVFLIPTRIDELKKLQKRCKESAKRLLKIMQ